MSQPIEIVKKAPKFTELNNLASDRLGASCLRCSDDFFAEMENLIKPGRGIFIPGKYTERGKWMDGWESRRKRVPGHDWCIVKLAAEGVISGVDIDTNFFLGNHPPIASIEAISSETDPDEDSKWEIILEKNHLDPGSQNFFEINSSKAWTHLRLNIFPDGGVARLKVYGEISKDWTTVDSEEEVELSSILEGGLAVNCNDMFFSNMSNLLVPGKGVDMGDGWETKRNRTPNNEDWVIIRLGCRGTINRILVDTHHFKGNYPDSCSISGWDGPENQIPGFDSSHWKTITPKVKLSAHAEHRLEEEIIEKGPFKYVKLSIFPDGGISRLRVFGTPA